MTNKDSKNRVLKTRIIILVFLYLLFVLPVLNHAVYKYNDIGYDYLNPLVITLTPKSGNGIKYDFYKDYKNSDIDVNFKLFFVKDISADVSYNDKTVETVIRGWLDCQYSSDFEYISCIWPILNDRENDTVVCVEDALKSDIYGTLTLRDREYNAVIHNGKFLSPSANYSVLREMGFLSSDIPVTFSGCNAFLEYYNLSCKDEEDRIDKIQDIRFDKAIFMIEQIYDREPIYKFMENFEENGFEVDGNTDELRSKIYYFDIAYFIIITAVFSVLIYRFGKQKQ